MQKRKFCKIREFSEITGMPKGTVYYLVSQNVIPSTTVGKTRLIPIEDIDQLEADSQNHENRRRYGKRK